MAKFTLRESVEHFVAERTSYYQQWIFEKPLIVSRKHHNDLAQLQKIMHKLITHFVSNYSTHMHLMPVGSEIEEVLTLCNQRVYKPGTYRTDFVYDHLGQVKLIEITSRFSLNGMFLGAIMSHVAQEYHRQHMPNLDILNPYEEIFEHLEQYLEGVEDIYVLTGKDRRNESKIYEPIFERMGIKVRGVHYSQVKENLSLLSSGWIISELAFDEILAIPKEVLEVLTTLNVTNDFRTIFLTHDKRFFEVLCNKEFQADTLTEEEILFLNRYLVPTYSYKNAPLEWEKARHNKNQWIIKHRALGKSQKIYAGIVTSAVEWEQIFQQPDLSDLVLQKWVDQKTVKGTIGVDQFDDFITGTLLFFDDHYFGFGDFRTSSFPVTNVVDHRKASSLILEQPSEAEDFKNYNYIAK